MKSGGVRPLLLGVAMTVLVGALGLVVASL